MRCNVLIVGDSGTGKSTSIRNLDPKTTVVLNTEQKQLPFKTKFDKQVFVNGFQSYQKSMEQLAKREDVDTIIIDSLSALQELVLVECKRTKKGFDIWSAYNDTLQDALLRTKEIDKLVIFTTLSEHILDDSGNSIIRSKVDGKKLSNSYIESCFTVVLHTLPKMEDGKMSYNFLTNTDGIRLCKSPMDMFEELTIPNDLQIVKTKIEEYYK